MAGQKNWDLIIEPRSSWFNFNAREIAAYQDLILMLVKRDFVAQYRQTILGPIWYVIQPVLTTLTFYFIFGRVAETSPSGVPTFLFYMAGVTCWQYFAECLTKTSSTFTDNANVFGKVYFPRIIIPISVVISNLLKFFIQLVLFLLLLGYELIFNDFSLHVEPIHFLLFPLIIILMACLGLGMGAIISSLTTKYRDLRFLVQFGVQLFMYATPVVYPLSMSALPEKFVIFLKLNPMTEILETFRLIFLGTGEVSLKLYAISVGMIVTIFILGVMMFNKVEKNFMDSV